jgi:hypothetical protein
MASRNMRIHVVPFCRISAGTLNKGIELINDIKHFQVHDYSWASANSMGVQDEERSSRSKVLKRVPRCACSELVSKSQRIFVPRII